MSMTAVLEPTIAEPTTHRAARRFYAPELDALRLVAFLLVFARHIANALGSVRQRASSNAGPMAVVQPATAAAAPISHTLAVVQGAMQSLDFGVCLFFFLSSFLITRLLLLEKQATGKVAVRDFYIRRSLRIWPLYFFFLAAVVVLSPVLPLLHSSTSRLWASVFFVANWAAVLHGWDSVAIQPLWSVSVEEQFYLLWPNFAKFGRRAIIAVSVIFALASLVTLAWVGHHPGATVTQTWPNTLVQSIFLSTGALTACLSSPETRRLGILSRLGLVAGGFVCWVVASAGFHIVRSGSPGPFALVAGYLMVALGTFLIFTGFAGWNQRPLPPWMLYLGRISYGLYVFHFACLVLAEQFLRLGPGRLLLHSASGYTVEALVALLGLALTLGCSALSYKFLEQPFLRLKSRFTAVQSRPA